MATTAEPTDEQAQVGQSWRDGFGRLRTPRATYEGNDGTVLHGAEAQAAFGAHWDRPTARTRFPVVQRPRRLDRLLGCGRPAAKRTPSRTATRGDPDLGEEGPGHRPRSLVGAVA
jgi:hypothetical protein